MALDDDIRVLSRVRLFQGLTQEQLRLIAFGAETFDLPAGRDLYREDVAADGAYIVLSGRVALYRTVDGARTIQSQVGTGTVLDEMALIVPSRREAGAAAVDDSQIMRVSRALFRRVLEEYPEAALELRNRLAARFTAMAEEAGRLKRHFED